MNANKISASPPLHRDMLPPSPWVVRFAAQIPRGGLVLDVACGSGRHSRYLAALGYRVDALDCDDTAFLDIPDGVNFVCADIEAGPWPFPDKRYAAVVVTNYLHRPLLRLLRDSVAPGGMFIYETFAVGNEQYGRPTRPAFLLRPNELYELINESAAHFSVIEFAASYVVSSKMAVVQSIAARRL